MRFLRAIPSWAVGVVGACIVVVSVTLGSFGLRYLDTQLNETEAVIEELSAVSEMRWTQHALAEGRAETAEVIVALSVSSVRAGNDGSPLLLNLAALHLEDAIEMMWLATPGARKDEVPSSEIEEWRIKLNDGDVLAYAEIAKLYHEQGRRSNQAIGDLRRDIAQHKERVAGFRRQVERIRDLQAGLNVLGLVVVLLKDLPIWSRHRDALEP